jgi:hypothetical protein
MLEKMSYAENELINLEEIHLDISQIVALTNRFYNLCTERIKEEKFILLLFEARTCLESSITMVKVLVEPKDNKYIEEVNEKHFSHDILEKYFENFMAILDVEQQKIVSYIEDSKKFASPFVVTAAVKTYRERLIDYMENLVLTPIYNAVVSYKNWVDVKKNENSKDVFEYFLFR